MSIVRYEELLSTSDAQATRDAYANFVPHVCMCATCRNFRPQLARIPEQVQALIERMGIDLPKPNEIVDYGRENAGRFCQVEWAYLRDEQFEFAGTATVRECDNWKVIVCDGGIPAKGFDESGRRSSLTFEIHGVPWILDDQEPTP